MERGARDQLIPQVALADQVAFRFARRRQNRDIARQNFGSNRQGLPVSQNVVEGAHYFGGLLWAGGHSGAQHYDFERQKPLLELDRDTLRLPTVVVGDGIKPETRGRFTSQTIRFSPKPIAAAQAANWCDIGILNATHGMLCAMLVAGKPTLNCVGIV